MCVSKRGHWGAIDVPWQEFPKGGRRGKEKRGRNAPPQMRRRQTDRESKPEQTLQSRWRLVYVYYLCTLLPKKLREGSATRNVPKLLTLFMDIRVHVVVTRHSAVLRPTTTYAKSNVTLTNERT